MSKDDKHNAQVALLWLMDHLETTDGEGVAPKNHAWGMKETYEYTLAQSLQRLLGKNTSDVQRVSYVRRSVHHFVRQRNGMPTIDAFVNHIKMNYLNTRGSKRFLVTAFLPKVFNTTPGHLTIDGVVLNNVDPMATVREYGALANIKGDLQNVLHGSKWEHDYSFRETTCYQYELAIPATRTNAGLPINELCQPIEKLRALINFAANYLRIEWRFSVHYVSPLSEVLPSPIYFIEDRDSAKVQLFYDRLTIAAYSLPGWIRDEVWQETQRLLERLSQTVVETGSIFHLIWQLLELRQKGTDSVDAAVSFLHYWQVIERAASPIQKNRGIENKKVVAHLATLFRLSPTERLALLNLGEIRNQFAHTGEYPHDIDDLPQRIVRRYADGCIMSLLFLKTAHLRHNGYVFLVFKSRCFREEEVFPEEFPFRKSKKSVLDYVIE